MTVTGTSATLESIPSRPEAWLEENWDPDLTVGEWWSAWAWPAGPAPGCPRLLRQGPLATARSRSSTIAEFGALSAPVGLGLLLAAPTIATHGTQEQIDLYIREIVTGGKAWCQLFSEPGAGSDLAGLTTRAVKDGDVWIVNGQKVWTSVATSPTWACSWPAPTPTPPSTRASPGSRRHAPGRHRGAAPQGDDRPARVQRGVPHRRRGGRRPHRRPQQRLDGHQHHPRFERFGHGSRRGCRRRRHGRPAASASSAAGPATWWRRPARPKGAKPALAGAAPRFTDMAWETASCRPHHPPTTSCPAHILGTLAKYNNLRHKAAKAAGKDIPGVANLSKLLMSTCCACSATSAWA